MGYGEFKSLPPFALGGFEGRCGMAAQRRWEVGGCGWGRGYTFLFEP